MLNNYFIRLNVEYKIPEILQNIFNVLVVWNVQTEVFKINFIHSVFSFLKRNPK